MLKEISNEIGIRYIAKGDEKDLMKLINSTVKEKSFVSFDKKVDLKTEREFVNNCIKEIEEGEAIYLVVEKNKRVVGICSIEKKGRIQKHVGAYGIVLGKGIRGIGIGTEMTKLIIKEAKSFLKIKIIQLSVFDRNYAAIGFYNKIGFKEIGRIKKAIKHFGKYYDEVIMVKYL